MPRIFKCIYLTSKSYVKSYDKLTLSHLLLMKPAKKIIYKNVDGDSMSRKRSDSPGFSSLLCFSAPASEICDGISIQAKIGTSNCHICLSRLERFFKVDVPERARLETRTGNFDSDQQGIAFAIVSWIFHLFPYRISSWRQTQTRRSEKFGKLGNTRKNYLFLSRTEFINANDLKTSSCTLPS